MALCGGESTVSFCVWRDRENCPSYQMLAQLDENAAILFQHFKCSLGATFVARLQDLGLFFLVLYRGFCV